METVAKSISQHAATLIVVLASAVLLLTLALVRVSTRLRSLTRRWEGFLADASGKDVETMLDRHLHERRDLISQHEETRRRVEILEDKMDGAKRHLGIVRYDAFDEVGGAQSFALALYDDKGDGVVVSSLVGRADCRVYGKALNRGRSERTLSQEEQRAIDEAQRAAPRPIIAP